MLQGPNSWHWPFSPEYWEILPDGAVYWALQSILEVGYIPLANGNDAFQWPGAKSLERYPLKSENLLRCQILLSVFLLCISFYLSSCGTRQLQCFTPSSGLLADALGVPEEDSLKSVHRNSVKCCLRWRSTCSLNLMKPISWYYIFPSCTFQLPSSPPSSFISCST